MHDYQLGQFYLIEESEKFGRRIDGPFETAMAADVSHSNNPYHYIGKAVIVEVVGILETRKEDDGGDR